MKRTFLSLCLSLFLLGCFPYTLESRKPTEPPDYTTYKFQEVKIDPKRVYTELIDIVIDPLLAAQIYAFDILGQKQYDCLYKLWQAESRWRVTATNKSSGAYGIPQAYPADKMASAGDDWKTNPLTQVKWGLGYIESRYKTACNAWSFFQQHRWY